MSRVSGEEPSSIAARERAEHAAARIGSIHERWRAAGNVGERPSSEPAPIPAPAPPIEVQRTVDALSATPLLGAVADADVPPTHRPRFKTLIGVPRSSPELDELAGLGPNQVHPAPSEFEAPPSAQLVASASVADGSAFSPSPVAPHASAPQPAAATAPSWPWEHEPSATGSNQHDSSILGERNALSSGSVDVSAEVAALRSVGRRRRWALTLLAGASLLGVFALTAPRERSLALRWLREAYASRTQSAAQALLPVPAAAGPQPSSSASDIATSQPLAPPSAGDVAAVPALAGASEPMATGAAPSEALPEEMKEGHPASANPAALEPITSATASALAVATKATPQAARASVASGSRTLPVAATRKRSPRAASMALGRTKPRSTRQNS
ncbi:MAG TPA: hypothetical protein VJU61_12180, partial [Polyangiaceae bacterium]|nr:hypothetical protein [Polyangiaceae bacterium]